MISHPEQTIIDKNIGNMPLLFQIDDYGVIGDETENNSANPQTMVVENQHINPPEEPELMANADYDAPKKPVSVFFISKNCLKQQNV
ncbi:uncharacterized protein TNCV_2181131 [Trichonephila clavipes]|uniref:Uncharacterized protein n=1 Tax=Trichonephila clavipes TaxID=2585209 RepID=A0A8X6VUN8_TRICX|nr:uncharacterized protein TNCV_2181131 [Trichonephila clavipes]